MITRKNLDFVSQELNKVLDLEPPIDISPKIKDKILIGDIEDVFKNVLEDDDILSNETEKILFDMGLIKITKEFLKKDSLKEIKKPKKIAEIKVIKKTKKTKKPNIKKFILNGFKDGTFENLKNKKIAEIVRERFDSKTSAASIAVYKCNFNKGNKGK